MNQPIEIFIKQVTYLPFSDVVSLCQSNTTYHNYCTNPKYNTNWKLLIDDTFSKIYNYQNKLDEIWKDLGVDKNTYNYLIYTQLIKYLDPITQLMILYRQKDPGFNSNKYNDTQRFLALFLLGDKKLVKYLPNEDYQPFVDLLDGKPVSRIDDMFNEMALQGSPTGVAYFVNKGADVHNNGNRGFKMAVKKGNLDVIKYLIENGFDIHSDDEYAIYGASNYGYLDLVKYLVENGADINSEDRPLTWAAESGHLDVVKYLVEKGANITAHALIWSLKNNKREVVKYLLNEKPSIIEELKDYLKTVGYTDDMINEELSKISKLIN